MDTATVTFDFDFDGVCTEPVLVAVASPDERPRTAERERVSASYPSANVVKLDRPFLYVVVDDETGIPWMIGTLVDPR